MFAVKFTLVDFKGDPERYPCHAMLNIGDEVTFDGAEFKGKMCIYALQAMMPVIYELYRTGPRYINPHSYNLFWNATLSTSAPDMEMYDGNGFKNYFGRYDEPPYHLISLMDPDAWHWPPIDNREQRKHAAMVMCPDVRTAAVFKVEAYDLATAAEGVPFTRRQMTIMDRVHKSGGAYPIAGIMELYTEFERNEIYPPLSDVMVREMIEELESLGYVKIGDGSVTVTEKGVQRVARYKDEIPEEHAKALKF